MSEDQAKQVKEERERYDKRRAEMAEPVDAEEVQAKADNGEALTLEELVAVNLPGARPHNDEAEIGKRYEGSDYAPAAQPDLSAPAYVLARQAQLAAQGKEDTRVDGSFSIVADKGEEENATSKAEKKAATKKADN